ncbi:hypothetical protein HanXRQr2_Chr03g0124121 [Helianthus annuus]|uniref:Uncharacterized protein n=1 Tax=Helianthus annuus TaxID=4232 RepID=A0A9K3JH48_HELAN|nr:hypothetical protein HanXRQr2_Chr03g0124121 [Helianthus annuus]KAJ0944803.1 hypothetical protein HanPSC8_Chr03g0120851 [Helianthus annuus]
MKLIMMSVYPLGLLGRSRASPYNVSESKRPPLPCGIAFEYLQSPTVGPTFE